MRELGEVLEGLFNEKPRINLSEVLKFIFNEIRTKYGRFQNKPAVNGTEELEELEKLFNDNCVDTNVSWSKVTKSVVGFRYKIFSERSGVSYDKIGIFCYENNYDISLMTFDHQGKQQIQFMPATISRKAIKEIYKKEEVFGVKIEEVKLWVLPITPDEFIQVWADARTRH